MLKTVSITPKRAPQNEGSLSRAEVGSVYAEYPLHLLNKFGKIAYLLDNLRTSPEYKDVLSKDLLNTFSNYYNRAYVHMQGYWNIAEVEVATDSVKGKMYIVQKLLSSIREDVIKRNPKSNS